MKTKTRLVVLGCLLGSIAMAEEKKAIAPMPRIVNPTAEDIAKSLYPTIDPKWVPKIDPKVLPLIDPQYLPDEFKPKPTAPAPRAVNPREMAPMPRVAPEIAPMPREAVVVPGGEAKPVTTNEVPPAQSKPAVKPVQRPNVFGSTPSLFPTTPKEIPASEPKPAPVQGTNTAETRPVPPKRYSENWLNPDLMRSRPQGMPGVLPQQPLPRPVPLPQPKPKAGADSLEKITGEKSAFEQFQKIANLDVLEASKADELRTRIADLDPTLNRAVLEGRNFELLGSKLFEDALDGVYVSALTNFKADVVIRFKDGSHFTILGLPLTGDEWMALGKNGELQRKMQDLLKEARGADAPEPEVGGNFTKVAKPKEALALLGQFSFENNGAGLSSVSGRKETIGWASLRAGARRTAPSSSRPMGKVDGKATHEKR